MGSKGLWPLSQHWGTTNPHLVVQQSPAVGPTCGVPHQSSLKKVTLGIFIMLWKISQFGPDQSGLQRKSLPGSCYHTSCHVLLWFTYKGWASGSSWHLWFQDLNELAHTSTRILSPPAFISPHHYFVRVFRKREWQLFIWDICPCKSYLVEPNSSPSTTTVEYFLF